MRPGAVGLPRKKPPRSFAAGRLCVSRQRGPGLGSGGVAAVQAFFHQVFKQNQHAGVKIVGRQVAVVQDVVVQQKEGEVGALGNGGVGRPGKRRNVDAVAFGVRHQFYDGVGGAAFADDDHQPCVQSVGFIHFVAVGTHGRVAHNQQLAHKKVAQRLAKARPGDQDRALAGKAQPVQERLDAAGRDLPNEGVDVGGVGLVAVPVAHQKAQAVDHIGVTGIPQLFAQPDDGGRRNIVARGKLAHTVLGLLFHGVQHGLQKQLVALAQVVLVGQFVDIVFHGCPLQYGVVPAQSPFFKLYDPARGKSRGAAKSAPQRAKNETCFDCGEHVQNLSRNLEEFVQG